MCACVTVAQNKGQFVPNKGTIGHETFLRLASKRDRSAIRTSELRTDFNTNRIEALRCTRVFQNSPLNCRKRGVEWLTKKKKVLNLFGGVNLAKSRPELLFKSYIFRCSSFFTCRLLMAGIGISPPFCPFVIFPSRRFSPSERLEHYRLCSRAPYIV